MPDELEEKEVEEEPQEPEEEVQEPEEPEEPEEEEEPQEPELMEIVHNGQVHKVTKEKLIELAQKGFDYDFKVGPHRKIVELVESDPELQALINEHVQKKISGSPKSEEDLPIVSFDEAEDPDTWLKQNMAALKESVKAEYEAKLNAQPAGPDIPTMLQMHDPQHYNDVMQVFWTKLEEQPYARVQKIDKDPAELVKFYDEIRADIASPEEKKKTPPFRVHSGAKNENSEKLKPNVWDLPRDKFEEVLRKAKGY